MEGDLHIGCHLPAFIQLGQICVDGFFHPGTDRRIILIRDPVNIQRISRLRRCCGYESGQQRKHQQQCDQFPHQSIPLIRLSKSFPRL